MMRAPFPAQGLLEAAGLREIPDDNVRTWQKELKDGTSLRLRYLGDPADIISPMDPLWRLNRVCRAEMGRVQATPLFSLFEGVAILARLPVPETLAFRIVDGLGLSSPITINRDDDFPEVRQLAESAMLCADTPAMLIHGFCPFYQDSGTQGWRKAHPGGGEIRLYSIGFSIGASAINARWFATRCRGGDGGFILLQSLHDITEIFDVAERLPMPPSQTTMVFHSMQEVEDAFGRCQDLALV
ncbi:hypothetical protein [Thalassospira xiamenensis]|uniref:Uncharacterized protein n=1 Tax=Thalassospira xiamenensis TaxID=220697 RepID=A0A285THN9_9PROT|nr:hypothetical protein [Thalassospira xiamenensis]SOC21722.1 hypothetical protein SAMN05428964_103473 [Thalassospira xiamenensis]